jgi:small subunit ribosomal protein S29
MAIDDFQALYCESTYRDPLFSRIKPWHLSMPRILLEYASGKKSFVSYPSLYFSDTQLTLFS